MPRGGIARSYGNSIFSFLRNSVLFSMASAPIYFPISGIGGFSFPPIFSRLMQYFLKKSKLMQKKVYNEQYKKKFFFVFCLFRATPAAHRGSQARGPIRAVVASLRHSHARSESRLPPTPQLMAMPDL